MRLKYELASEPLQLSCLALQAVRTGSWMGPPQGKRAPRVGPISIVIPWLSHRRRTSSTRSWPRTTLATPEREFLNDNLLVRIHLIIVMIRWTGLAPWEFDFPFPGVGPAACGAGLTTHWLRRVPGQALEGGPQHGLPVIFFFLFFITLKPRVERYKSL